MLWPPLNHQAEELPTSQYESPSSEIHTPSWVDILAISLVPGSAKLGHQMSLTLEPYESPGKSMQRPQHFQCLRSNIKSSNYAAPHLHFQPLSTLLPRAERCQDQLVCCTLGITPCNISKAKKLSYLQRELNNLSKVRSPTAEKLQPKSSVLSVLPKICCPFEVLAIFLQK